MNVTKQSLMSVITALLLVASGPAAAISAGELLQEKDSKLIGNYLAGLVDMMSYMEHVNGNNERGKCINNWYYDTDGSIEKVYGYLEQYPDKFPGAILLVLAKRSCPLPEQGG